MASTQLSSSPAIAVRRDGLSRLESVSPAGGAGKPARTITAQTVTGPAQAPRPTSSTPATRAAPAAASSRSISYPGPAGLAAADAAAAPATAGPFPNVSCSTAAMMARPAPGVTANRRASRR